MDVGVGGITAISLPVFFKIKTRCLKNQKSDSNMSPELKSDMHFDLCSPSTTHLASFPAYKIKLNFFTVKTDFP